MNRQVNTRRWWVPLIGTVAQIVLGVWLFVFDDYLGWFVGPVLVAIGVYGTVVTVGLRFDWGWVRRIPGVTR